jgi:hypothetical protein
MPYQRRTFVTPAFPGYVSGHSTFSRAAAEVLTLITGSEYLPGGLGTHTVRMDTLIHEKGPTVDVELQWATYYDAADLAGLSRIWGGIHPPADDFPGRKIGAACGQAAWALASKYFDGSISDAGAPLVIRQAGSAGCELRYETIRGFYYALEGTPNLNIPFSALNGGYTRAENTFAVRTNGFTGRVNFYRVVTAQAP